MSKPRDSYDDLLAAGWVPDTAKGVTTSRYTSLSLCLVQDGHRVGCVQGYGPTLRDAQADAAAQAATWIRRHEREAGTDVLSHRRRDTSTKLRSKSPSQAATEGIPSSEPPRN